MFANEKGQAFSTFQLLISAVVAVAILSILFYVLGIIPGIVPTEPAKVVGDAVVQASSSFKTPKTTQSAFTFNRDNDTLSRSSLAESAKQAGLAGENICILLGDFEDNPTFEYVTEGASIRLTTSQQKVKATVLCDYGYEALNITLEDYVTLKEIADLSKCPNDSPCSTGYTGTNTCCIVVLRFGGG